MVVPPAVLNVASVLGESVAWALLEQHLNASHVDLAVLMSAGRSRERLRARIVENPDWPEGWADAGRALFAWLWPANPVSEARQLSFEWDCRPDPSAPFPFVTFEHAVGVATSAERALRIASAFALAVDRRGLSETDQAIVGNLPATGSTLHFACLGARGAGARRWVNAMEPGDVEGFLRRLQWRGDAARVGQLARKWGVAAPHVSVHLDSADGVRERVGLEIFYPGPPMLDRRWTPLMDDLRTLCLSTPERLDALRTWPGAHHGLTRLLDMKVVFEPEGPVEAKAYLAFCRTEDPKPGA